MAWASRPTNWLVVFGFLLYAVAGFPANQAATATPAAQSGQFKRLYVEAFHGTRGAPELHAKFVERLRADHRWQLVESSETADAIVSGNGETWLKGYVSSGPHANSSWHQPVYGGYLSLTVKDRNGRILWSYLVTPGRMHWNGVDQDMAEHAIRLMDAVLGETASSNEATSANPGSHTVLVGAGSTFAGPIFQEWLESFEHVRPDIHATYESVGSENGIKALQEAHADFAASDVRVSTALAPSLAANVQQYATVLGGVVVAYNLPDAGSDLRFTPQILAAIYMGKITRWNDPKLRELNHGSKLPDEPIAVIHRSDGSGTTYAWTGFLSETSPEWRNSAGTGMTVRWPTGEAEDGNEGVASKVAETPGAIGYVELTYAIRHHLSFGLVRNGAGSFVQANLTTLAAAVKSAPHERGLPGSLIEAPGKDAYPIATFTWIIIPEERSDAPRSAAVRDLVRWMLTAGQKECAGLGYLPLPKETVDFEIRQLDASAR